LGAALRGALDGALEVGGVGDVEPLQVEAERPRAAQEDGAACGPSSAVDRSTAMRASPGRASFSTKPELGSGLAPPGALPNDGRPIRAGSAARAKHRPERRGGDQGSECTSTDHGDDLLARARAASTTAGAERSSRCRPGRHPLS
jgi:hypothetical protein